MQNYISGACAPKSDVSYRALGKHFLLRVWGPHHLNFQGPQAKFKGSLHWNTLPILQFGGVHWALRQNFTRAPLDFQGPLPPGPESPALIYVLYKIPLAQANFLLTQAAQNLLAFVSGRALVSPMVLLEKKLSNQIKSLFCRCLENWTLVTYEKWCPDWSIWFKIRTKRISLFTRFQLRAHQPLKICEIVPRLPSWF